MSLPKINSADGRFCYINNDNREELQPFFDQCLQDIIDGNVTLLDNKYIIVVVSSEGVPFSMFDILRSYTEIQRAETINADKMIAFCENLRRLSKWNRIDYYLLDMLKRELQEKYFIVTDSEDDYFKNREYSLKPGVRRIFQKIYCALLAMWR